jgi:3-oxoacyl-ACP reductase-like protein
MFKRIGASECLERDRGPGGPPSGMKWSAFAKQTKKRWRLPASRTQSVYAGIIKWNIRYCYSGR